MIVSLGAVAGKAVLSGLGHAVSAGLADRFAAAFVLVVRGDIADALVEPDRVVVDSCGVELGAEDLRVGDREQVRPLGFDGSVERLDPGLGAPWKALTI